jgi:hypothetical protein
MTFPTGSSFTRRFIWSNFEIIYGRPSTLLKRTGGVERQLLDPFVPQYKNECPGMRLRVSGYSPPTISLRERVVGFTTTCCEIQFGGF